ncbi:hypothetical protein [Thauera sp.]|uniref:hypothetical protein n=1 Tax=Thauera sp. TaxID=1905334 RepID=UPI0039E5AC45
MATQHEIEMTLNIVDRGARVALTVGEPDGQDVRIVIHLVSGCATPKRIGHITVSETTAIGLCMQLGEALGL